MCSSGVQHFYDFKKKTICKHLPRESVSPMLSGDVEIKKKLFVEYDQSTKKTKNGRILI